MKKKLLGIALCVLLLVGVLAMSASASGIIKSITFNGLNEPYPGEEMDFGVTPLFGNLYEVAENGYGIFWYDDTTGEDCPWDQNNPPKFIEDHVYKVRIYVEAKDGNEFAADPTTMTAFIDDTKASVHTDSNGYFIQTYFDPCGTGAVGNIEINIPAPEIGAKPSFEKIENPKYVSDGAVSPERNGIKWYDVTAGKHLISGTTSAIFESHHVYKVMFSIERTYNFEFSAGTTATVNGKAAEISFSSPYDATVTYTFDELGCAPEFVEGEFPSCDKTGHVGYFACACGKWYWNKEATEPVGDKEEIVIPPTGHYGGTATCKAKAKCTSCGKEYGSLKSHDYKAATCTAPKTCKVCKATTGKAKGHKYDNNCDTTCNTCKATRKITHTYKTSSTTKATLSKNGKVVSKCSVCGATKNTTVYYPKTIKLSKTSFNYNGKVQTPSVTVKDTKGNTLKKDTDYTVKYSSGRKNIGKYTVTITFKGKYTGSKKLTYTIVPKTTSKVTASQTTTSVTLKWNKVTGATGYRVFQKVDGKWKTLTNTSKLTYTIKKLKTGAKYSFAVRPYTVVNKETILASTYTQIGTATKTATPTLKVSSSKKGVAALSWTNVAGETGYQVYYSTKKDSGFKSLASYNGNVVKGSKTGLTSKKTYYFKVRAYKKTDSGTVYSAWSSVKSIKIK